MHNDPPASTPGLPWRWLAGFCLARALFSTTQTSYSAVLPLLKTDWAMSASEAGLISSAYYGGFLVSLFAVGFLADRFGARRTYLGTSLAAALSALAFAWLANGFISGLLLYGLTGLFAGGSYTPGLAIVAQRFPSLGRGRAIGFYIAASSLGYAVSLLASSAMLSLAGWREAFWVTCSGPTLGMVLGTLALWRHRDPPRAPQQTLADGGPGTLWQSVLGNRPVMLIILAYTFHSWEVLGLWAWTPYYLSHTFANGLGGGLAGGLGGGLAGAALAGSDGDAASVGAIFTALAFVVAMFGPILGGTLSDRLGRTTVIISLSLVSTFCAFTVGWLAAAPFWLVVALTIVFQVSSIGDSPVLSTALTELVAPRYLGSAYSLRSVMGFGMGVVSPWVFGLVLDWGQAGGTTPGWITFGLAFTTLGLGGMFAPYFAWRLRLQAESSRMAGGMR